MTPFCCTRCSWRGGEIATTEFKVVEADGTYKRLWGALCPRCYGPARRYIEPVPSLESRVTALEQRQDADNRVLGDSVMVRS